LEKVKIAKEFISYYEKYPTDLPCGVDHTLYI
jgi:hypothetical protein